MSDLSDMYILIISIYWCKQTAEYFFKNCKQLNLNPIIVQLFVYIFHCKYWRAVAQPLIHTSTIIFPWKNFFYVKWTQPKTKTLPDIMMMNKILLKLRIMVSFLYLNWKKKTIFCKIITTIFFLVSKMKQKKQQNYSYLKKYQITTIIIIINISLPTHARYIKYWKIVKQILKTNKNCRIFNKKHQVFL